MDGGFIGKREQDVEPKCRGVGVGQGEGERMFDLFIYTGGVLFFLPFISVLGS